MQKRFTSIVASCAVALTCVTTTAAQTPAPDRIVVASPTYTFIPMEIDVDRPARALMIVVTEARNAAEYAGKQPTPTEGEAVRSAWAAVLDWARTRGIEAEA